MAKSASVLHSFCGISASLLVAACGGSSPATGDGGDVDASAAADAAHRDAATTDVRQAHDAAKDTGRVGRDAAADTGRADGRVQADTGGSDTGQVDAGRDAGDEAGHEAGPPPIPPTFDGPVLSLVHAGTSWFAGGAFNRANAVAAPNFLALQANGVPAPACAFGSGFDGRVLAVVETATAIYAGGDFRNYAGAPANHVAKIDATTCALDTTFTGGSSGGFDGEVWTLALSTDSLIVGGEFTGYAGVAGSANHIAKLDLTSGALDTTFSPPANNGFSAIAFSFAVSGSSLYAGGELTSYRGAAVGQLVKLDLTTGALDPTFPTNTAIGNVFAIALANSSVYIGGVFTKYGAQQSANHIAKLDQTTGALDTTFSPSAANGFSDVVWSLVPSGSSIYVGGQFTGYRGVAASAEYVAKLDATSGALDTTFTSPGSGLDGVVNALALSGTSLLVGGQFTEYRGAAGSANNLAKLDLTSGAQDTTFKLSGANEVNGFDGYVTSFAGSGATLLVGGAFASYGGVIANNVARFDDTTLALDPIFFGSDPLTSGFDQSISSMVATSTSLYLGGYFTAYQGVANSARSVAKIDLVTGALDTTFSPAGATANGFDQDVEALAVSATSLYVGGGFRSYRGVTDSANYLAKLDLASGALDATFSPAGATANGFNSAVDACLVVGSSLYVGGQFTAYRGVAQSANYLAKVDVTTGALDMTFSPAGQMANGFDAGVTALTRAGSSLYVGGSFSAYRGATSSANGLAKLDLASGALDTGFSPPGATANGFAAGNVSVLAASATSLYVGGSFSTYRGVASSANDLARLDLTTGAIDTTFSPVGASSNGVGGMFSGVNAIGPSGTSVFVGGYFVTYRGAAAQNFVYLSSTGARE